MIEEGHVMLHTEEKHLLLRTARKSIHDTLVITTLPEQREFASLHDMYQRYPVLGEHLGVFVTLRKKDPVDPKLDLRGCIGTIIGRESLYEGVCRLAKESAFSDPRFPPLEKSELSDIIIEISVLSKLHRISSYHEIVLGRDGILLSSSGRSSVFLPQVAIEQGWDLDTTLRYLSLKAGLSEEAYKDPLCLFEVFQAEVFEEQEE